MSLTKSMKFISIIIFLFHIKHNNRVLFTEFLRYFLSQLRSRILLYVGQKIETKDNSRGTKNKY